MTGYAKTPRVHAEQGVLTAIYNGYNNDGSDVAGIKSAAGLVSNEEFRFATQLAVWYFIDSYDAKTYDDYLGAAPMATRDRILKAYKMLTGQDNTISLKAYPSASTLDIFTPSYYRGAVSDVQNLVGAEFVDPKTATPVDETPMTTTPVTTAPAVTSTVTTTPTVTATTTARATTVTTTEPAPTVTSTYTKPATTTVETTTLEPVTKTSTVTPTPVTSTLPAETKTATATPAPKTTTATTTLPVVTSTVPGTTVTTTLPHTTEVVKGPWIGTTATDKADNDKVTSNQGGTVVDAIEYHGLTPGETCTMSGELVTKDGKSTGLTGTTTFVATAADGTIPVEIVVPADKFAGKVLVAFETLLDSTGKQIAEHKDVKDGNQTVVVTDDSGKVPNVPGETIDWWKVLVPVAIVGGLLVGGNGPITAGNTPVNGGNAPAPRADEVMGISNPKPGNQDQTASKAPKQGAQAQQSPAKKMLASTSASVIGLAVAAALIMALGIALAAKRRKES